ncbi:helix-turn-helix domain-containing protein [Halomonas elongata]|uniref:helix-turn-helix domain-containing protein n=1 Tax=Halomonas elongata TaxID=2746 RepID=UPI004033B046
MSDKASTTVGEKIRAIREAEQVGRQEFSDLTGIPKNTLIRLEQGRNAPSGRVLMQVTQAFPQYTMWLMNDQVIEEAGQVSPEIERARKSLKQTGTDTD